MPPAKKPPRCAYVEGNRRCGRPGTGNPPLCEAHRIVLEDEAARPVRPGEKFVGLLGRVLRGQKVNDGHLHAGIEDLVGMFSSRLGDPPDHRSPLDAARARAEDFLRRAGATPRPPPPPRPRKPAGPDPRVVLGFAAGQKVTAAEVKARHRELARRHHPDHGGDGRKMQEVNAAVDQLLGTL